MATDYDRIAAEFEAAAAEASRLRIAGIQASLSGRKLTAAARRRLTAAETRERELSRELDAAR